jgi:dihydropteroate synthase
MHTPVKPETMQWSTGTSSDGSDILNRVNRFLANSIAIAERHAIHDIIIDPGFGFGKSVAENFQLLSQLSSLCALERPILAGLSRKSFLGHAITLQGGEIPPPSERLPATIAADTIALINGASILRVHDVEAAMQSMLIVEALKKF